MKKIAVIGMSNLFPGSRNNAEFWQNLMDKKDCRSKATPSQMEGDPEAFYDSKKGVDDKYYCMDGGYIQEFTMNADGLLLSEEQLNSLDDIFKWSLYTAREALRDSGYLGNQAVLDHCGVILGNLSFPTKSSNQIFLPVYHKALSDSMATLLGDDSFVIPRFAESRSVLPHNALISGYPSAMISQALNLKGSNFSLDAACASSLYSAKLACNYLLSGRADIMLAGAVSGADPLFVNMGFSIFQAYPENKISAPLDRRSQGLFAGEGAGMLVLKRYDDAIRDGDHVYATICGGGLSNDGKGQFVLSPNTKGQVLAYERAFKEAQLTADDIDYVECHATGTPLGDKVELTSMESFFANGKRVPYIGSVKSNLGHLLTAAGMPGMMKVILGLRNGVIPPTINIEQPQASLNKHFGKEQIVSDLMQWPAREADAPKRAGVSVFGFGGANAHLIFEEEQQSSQSGAKADPQVEAPVTRAQMAIVGMDAYFGDCDGIDAFDQTSYEGRQHFKPLPKNRWKGLENDLTVCEVLNAIPEGAYIDEFDLDFLRFKIPPNEDDRLIPQQLLLLKVADRALQDAGVEPSANVAVLVAMGTELELHQFRGRVNLQAQFEQAWHHSQSKLDDVAKATLEDITKGSIHGLAKLNQYTSSIGNIMASRVSSLWDFSGPAFTVSAEENSVFRAIEIAQLLFETSDVEAVIVGAVDLAGGIENVLLRNIFGPVAHGKASLSIEKDVNGWQVGEGAGAIVLMRSADAEAQGNKIYANIDGIGFEVGVNADNMAIACRTALQRAQVQPSQVEYIEMYGAGFVEQDSAELGALLSVYSQDFAKQSDETPRFALGSVKANVGHSFNASGIASVIRTALCLSNRYIPATPQWTEPKDIGLDWSGTGFYVPTESKTWLKNQNEGLRRAAVNGLGMDGSSCHLVLSESVQSKAREAAETRESDEALRSAKILNNALHRQMQQLIIVKGNDLSDFNTQLGAVREQLTQGKSVSAIANDCFQQSKNTTTSRYSLALVAGSAPEFDKEIVMALKGVESLLAVKGRTNDWVSPNGSCFTVNPLGKNGKLSFVYPGAFNSYSGIGKDLFYLLPELHRYAEHQSERLATLVGDHLFNPRGMTRMTADARRQYDRSLTDHPINMFENGISHAITYTDIIREIFKVKPDSAFGYSMGEVSMMYALGVWGKTDGMSDILRSTPVFQSRLAGSMDTLRDAWNLPKESVADNTFWSGYTVQITPEKMLAAIKGEEFVRMILVNSPNEVVIAGRPEHCQSVLDIIGCDYVAAALGDVIHCDLVRADYQGLADLHKMPVTDPKNVNFFTAVGYKPLAISSEGIAHNIAEMYCNPVDFPKLVNTVYEDGNRVFLELGPRDGCTRNIGAILGDKEHLSVAINRKGAGDYNSLLRAFAKLASHQVDLDLSRLYHDSARPDTAKRQLIKAVSLGAVPLQSKIVNEENIKAFRQSIDVTRSTKSTTNEIKAVESLVTKTYTSATNPFKSNTSPTYPFQIKVENSVGVNSNENDKAVKNPGVTSEMSNEKVPNAVASEITTISLKKGIKTSSRTQAVLPTNTLKPDLTATADDAKEKNSMSITNNKNTSNEHLNYRVEVSTDIDSALMDQYRSNMSRVSSAHSLFLEARRSTMKSVAELISLQATAAAQGQSLSDSQLELLRRAPIEALANSPIQAMPVATPPSIAKSSPAIPVTATVTTATITTDKASSAKASSAKTTTINAPASAPAAIKAVVSAPVAASPVITSPAPSKEKRKEVIWDEADLVEFAEGDIANVFGKEFAIIDTYPRRVRLPTTEYLLVSRVTKLNATPRKFEPCSITTEYDIPYNAWYAVDGQIPWAISVESGQCDLLLISYLGIDFENKGEYVYRLLDCTLTFMDDIPVEGQTLRYDIKINNYARNGNNLLFFFSYECFVGDKMVLKMDGGAAGFFNDKELSEGKGVIETEAEKAAKAKIQKQTFQPFLHCAKRQYDYNDMLALCRGDLVSCFGEEYNTGGRNKGLVYSAPKMLMIERITKVEPTGGAWGLGLLEGEKTLHPDHWYFPCHFKDDQVMAGSLMSDGCGQLLRFYSFFLGLQTKTKNARFQPIANLPQKVRCRGQVRPQHGTLIYRMEVTEIGLEPTPYAKANVDIILNGKIVVDFKNLGLYLKEGEVVGIDASTLPGGGARVSGRPANVMTKGLYEPRIPPFKPFPGNSLDLNYKPDTVPYTDYHFTEFATGRIANCFGEEFACYDGRTPPRTPNADLQLTTRVVEVIGTRHALKTKSTVVAEFDVPKDAWFYTENSYESLMPYSILMEIALQPCGFISAWAGTTLQSPETDLYFRNLDGSGNLLKEIDLRGKTITNRSSLLSTVSAGNTIIQSFEFDLSTEGETFYKGTAVFGYFLADALKHQLGMDNGKLKEPWHVEQGVNPATVLSLDMNSADVKQHFYQAKPGKPFYRLAGKQLNFVDRVDIVENHGSAKKGFVFAEKVIVKDDWFFPCHFHQDPVMPGSLGVEAMMQCLQIFALQQDLGKKFKNPRFDQVVDLIKWKYRGQIIPANKKMTLDLHITNIIEDDNSVQVVATGNLYKDGLRIYEVSDLTLRLVEAE